MSTLKTKGFYDVLTRLIDDITTRSSKLTDFNPGSALRTLSEAISMQFEEFYFAMRQNILYGIENGVYEAFGFPRKTAVTSSGVVCVQFESALTSAVTIPSGTQFITNEDEGYLEFNSVEDTIAPAGSISIEVTVECTKSGTIGNVSAGAITTMTSSASVIKMVSNPKAFTNGVDAETNTERRKRFQQYIRSLSRGTAESILYATLQVEGVSGAYVDDRYVGYVNLYAHNSDGELPDDLKTKVNSAVEEYRSAGIEVILCVPTKKEISITSKIQIDSEYSVSEYCYKLADYIYRYMNELTVGQPFYLSQLVHSLQSAYPDIIENIVFTKGEDVDSTYKDLVRPGTIHVTCNDVDGDVASTDSY